MHFTLARLRLSQNTLPCLILGDRNSRGGLVKLISIHKKGEDFLNQTLTESDHNKVK